MRSLALKLESIHDDAIDKLRHYRSGRIRMGRQEAMGAAGKLGRRPFVKIVTGVTSKGIPTKKNVQGKKSYREAVGTGARGVYYNWILKHGQCVQIQEAISRKRSKKYFAIVIDGSLHKITKIQAALYAAGEISIEG